VNRKDIIAELVRGELIGSRVSVVGTPLRGKILDETKTRFVLLTEDNKRKIIVKAQNAFEFEFKGEKIIIKGSLLAVKPEERIRLKIKWQ